MPKIGTGVPVLNRITDITKNERMVHNLGRQQMQLDKVQGQLSTGKRISRPGDDPSAATNQMYFRTRLEELQQFESNIGEGTARLNLVDGELARVTDILQRVRVLTVQAANGIYQGDNSFALRNAIAVEVDQHLRAMIDIANTRDGTGRSLFGGHSSSSPPFEVVHENATNSLTNEWDNKITQVNYLGDIGKQFREVERDQYIEVNLAGNRAFWATNMNITSGVDSSSYRALVAQSFRIDGTEIRVTAGDTLDDIIDKVNHAGLNVRASKVGQDNIALDTLSPHQMWLEDVDSSTVLQDLGLLNPNQASAANAYADNAKVSGLSVFGMLVKLRESLISGDQLEIGGRDLGNVDEAIDNVLHHRTQAGGRLHRLEQLEKRVSWDETYMMELLAKSESVDIPETIVRLKWLESVHNYALNVGARIIRPQLLDFLR